MLRSLTQTADRLGRFNEVASLAGRNIAAALVAVMTAVVMTNVIFRYGFDNSLSWAEDTSILSMIWLAFLTAPYAYRRSIHVGIDMILLALPNVLNRLVRIAINLLILWLLVRFMIEAITYVERGWRMRANTIDLPIAWFRMIVPASLALLMTTAIELIVRDLATLLDGDRDHALPPLPRDAE